MTGLTIPDAARDAAWTAFYKHRHEPDWMNHVLEAVYPILTLHAVAAVRAQWDAAIDAGVAAEREHIAAAIEAARVPDDAPVSFNFVYNHAARISRAGGQQ